MKTEIKKRKYLFIPLVLLLLLISSPVGEMYSKYVTKRNAGTINIKVIADRGPFILDPGTLVNKAMKGVQDENTVDEKIESVIFGKRYDYLSIVEELEGINVDVEHLGKIQCFRVPNENGGIDIYILSNGDILANEDCSNMFLNCQALDSITFGNINTLNTTDMHHMFSGLSEIKTLDLSKLDTSKVVDMSHMLEKCPNLELIDLTSINTSSCENMSFMFYGDTGITEFNIAPMDTSLVETMESMLEGCSGLIDVQMAGAETNSLLNTKRMFYGCSGLVEIDLSKFDMKNVIDAEDMLGGCSGLETIYSPINVNVDVDSFLPVTEGQYWYDMSGVAA